MDSGIQVIGLRRLLDTLDKAQQGELRSKILDEAASVVLSNTRTRFLRERDPDGKPWVPSQAGVKRRSQGGTGTLFDTGRLFRSIQIARTSSTRQREIGTDVPYSVYLHEGTSFMPARKILGLPPSDISQIKGVVEYQARKILK